MRDQIIVIIAVAFATTAVAVNVLALSYADDHRAENERVAVAAAWAQPIVPSTTNAPDTTAGTAEPSGCDPSPSRSTMVFRRRRARTRKTASPPAR